MANQLRVVLLAAGDSKLFQDYGFATPKSNLTVKPGAKAQIQSMLTTNGRGVERVLLDKIASTVIVCRTESGIPNLSYPYNAVRVSITQRGSASSAVLASAHIDPTDSVILVEADQYFTDYSFIGDIWKYLQMESTGNPLVYGAVISVAPDTSEWNAAVPTVLPLPDTVSKPDDTPRIRLFNAPVSPEIGELTGDSAHARARIAGVYFVSNWGCFLGCYADEVAFSAESDDRESSISVMDVMATMEVQFPQQMTYITAPISTWKPCATPDLYVINRGY